MNPPPGNVGLLLARTRVLGWLHLLLLPAAGWVVAGQGQAWRLLLAVLAGAGLLAAAYAYDDHNDSGRRHGQGWFVAPLLLALMAVLFLSGVARVGAICFAVLVGLHSGPMRLKATPLAGTLLTALGFPMLCLLGVATMNGAAWSLLGLAGLWIASGQLVYESANLTRDRVQGLRTSAAMLGPLASNRISLALLLMAAPVALGISSVAAVAMALYAAAVGLLGRGLAPAHLRLAMRFLGIGWAVLVGADLLSRAGL